MNIRSFLGILLFVSPLAGTWAQKFSTKFYNIKDGLPQSQVLSVAEDKLGYLWIGTYGGGLARFDGKHFAIYTLDDGICDNYVHKVYVDSHNGIWAGTSKGLSKFDGNKFLNYDHLTEVFTQMVEFNDTLFVVDRNHRLSKIVNGVVSCTDCSIHGANQIVFLAANTTDCFYFMEDSTVLRRKDKSGVGKIDISGLGKLHNIFPTGDSAIIISSTGAYRWNKKKLKLVDKRINTPLILTDNELTNFWQRNSDGLVKITRNASGFMEEIIKLDALATDGITDTEGNTWIGTSGSGLMKYFASDFELMGSPITVSVLKSNNKLWVATRYQGVNVYANHRLERNIPMESLGRRLKTLKEDKEGNIWVAAASDIAKIDPRSYRIERYTDQDGLKSTTIGNIEMGSKRLWVSYRGQGIQFWDGKRFNDFPLNNQLSSMDVLGLKYIPYGDRLLVCTSYGVDELRNGAISPLNLPEFYKTPVLCAASYKTKYVILGTDGKGLCIYNLDNASVKYYSKKHGLKSGLICFVDTDDMGYVWIGSNFGIEKIKFNEKLEIDEHYYFSDANGLNGLETNVNASFISGDGKYFGLIDGLYRYSPKAGDPPLDFALHFTNAELLNSSLSLSAFAKNTYGYYKVPLNPQLPHDQNSLRFSFSKVSKRYPESTEYKFILEGFETEWSLQNIGEVSYKNLPPGNYTFRVMTSDFSGKWRNPNLAYAFTIARPFYQTTLFMVMSFVVVMSLIGLAIYYQMRKNMLNALALEKVKAKELIRLRKEIGRDFHDELGNQLARIVNYISQIKMHRGENFEMLGLVEESAKNLITGTRDFIWALDHENDSLSNLFINLKDFGDRLFSEKNIEFRAFHTIRKDTILPMGYTRQINLIVKESMTNCFKHANAARVDLDFQELSSDLRISLKDNGVGIGVDKEFSNGGLSNIRHRAERINSRFEIRSNGQGTEITLYVNFKS